MDEQQHRCPSCGMPNAADAEFCATCGRPLAAAQPAGQLPVAEQPRAASAPLPPPPTPAQPAPPPAPSPSASAPAAPAPAPPPPAAAAPPPVAYPPPPVAPPATYPPPMAPVPFPTERPLSGGQKTGQFFGGIGLGLAGFVAIVLITILTINALGPALGPSSGFLALVPVALFVAFVVVMSFLLANPRARWLGYGLLAALVALPVIVVVGCVVILSVSFRTG